MAFLNGFRQHLALGLSNGKRRCFSSTRIQCLPVHLSSYYIPTLHSQAVTEEQLHSVKLLVRGGYIRQSSSGFYTFLPLGLRMIQKIEKIVDEEMEKIGASKVELPSLLSSALWHKSGRYNTMGSELYKLKDRTGSEYVLAPTFEEEVTKLVGREVYSWRNLPVKIYQTSRKYRDEPRPRNGLLRTREFLMKDLYSFDADLRSAEVTYKQVQTAYKAIMTRLFGEQEVGWRIAEADTGAMGGSRSHEYQVQDEAGEDNLMICNSCSYTANEELAASLPSQAATMPVDGEDVQVALFGSDDLLHHACTLTAVVLPKQRRVNPVKIARYIAEDGRKILSSHSTWDWKDRPEGPMVRFDKLQILLDIECRAVEAEEIGRVILQAIEGFAMRKGSQISASGPSLSAPTLQDYFQGGSSTSEAITTDVVDVHLAEADDKCASCRGGTLERTKAIEVGHTFILGTRYSDALGYTFAKKGGVDDDRTASVQMGCYGIGITRILGVLAQVSSRQSQVTKIEKQQEGDAEVLSNNDNAVHSGFKWNSNVAPFGALILPNRWDDQKKQATEIICQALQLERNLANRLQSQDIAIDDRDISLGKKFADADLVGYPTILILGREFDSSGQVEVRTRTKDGVFKRLIPFAHYSKLIESELTNLS